MHLVLALDARATDNLAFVGHPVVDHERNLNRHRVASLPFNDTDVLRTADDLPTGVALND
jgi:hypothetical protein